MIRLVDLFCSLIGLLLLLPVFLVVGTVIKLEDGGPVFFKQLRVGYNGYHFWILKFRTMKARAGNQGLSLTVGRDTRIFPAGQWIRAWKLDELPQLVNVVLGQMSLVGPRPEVPHFVELYTTDQAKVLLIRPGITDVASIMYRFENEVLLRCQDPEAFYIANILPNKIRLNLNYASTANVWTHFKVILSTLGVLKSSVRVMQPGDLRAFDRVPSASAICRVTSTRVPAEVHTVNLCLGGILLESLPVAVGDTCTLAISDEDQAPATITIAGTVIRNNADGAAIRFTSPLENKRYDVWGRAS